MNPKPPVRFPRLSANLGALPQGGWAAWPLSWKVTSLVLMAGLGVFGYRRGSRIQKSCPTCKAALPAIGWTLLVWPFGVGYTVGRVKG